MTGEPIFLFGTLRHVPLLHAVAGAPLELTPAVLQGFSAQTVEGEDFPVLRADAAAQAQGLLVSPDAAAEARLTAYEAPFGYVLRHVQVQTPDGMQQARAYFDDARPYETSGPWDLSAWEDRYGEIATRAAPEIVAMIPHVPPERVDIYAQMVWARAQAELNAAKWKRPRSLGRQMGHDQFTIAAQRSEFFGFFALDNYRFSHARLSGGPPMQVDRVVFRVGEAVTVLPYDPVRDRVLLIEQFRAGPAAQNDPEPWLLEPVAGLVDPAETIEAAGLREAEEEAGIHVSEMHFIARYYPSPGGIAQVLHSYIGIADLPDALQGTRGGKADEGEDIAIHLVGFDHFMAMFESGELANAPILLSAQHLAQHRASLRNER